MVTVSQTALGINEGDKFGAWTVAGPPFRFSFSPHYRAVLRCNCGFVTVGQLHNLKTGASTCCKSCGGTIHGQSRTRLYGIWRHMITRCHKPDDTQFHNYGARGIAVCQEWRESFDVFKAWAEANGYADTLEIDRENNNLNYSPDNCRWVTRTVNSLNKRTTRFVTAFSETKTAKAWCDDERCKVTYHVLHERLVRFGWDAERAISTPCRTMHKRRVG